MIAQRVGSWRGKIHSTERWLCVSGGLDAGISYEAIGSTSSGGCITESLNSLRASLLSSDPPSRLSVIGVVFSAEGEQARELQYTHTNSSHHISHGYPMPPGENPDFLICGYSYTTRLGSVFVRYLPLAKLLWPPDSALAPLHMHRRGEENIYEKHASGISGLHVASFPQVN